MFGQQDNPSGQQDPNHIPDQSIDAAMASDTPATPVTQTVQPSAPVPAQPDDGTLLVNQGGDAADDRLTPGTLNEPTPTTSQTASDNGGADNPSAASTNGDGGDAPNAPTVDANELIDIKQQALQQLSPLVGHLDQTPEEKFRTTMMMIQASDDQSLIRSAFESAGQIADEKVRAQALLDVINEINYFTQHGNQ